MGTSGVPWHRAYEIVDQRQLDFIADFKKRLAASTRVEIPSAEKDLLSSPESAQKLVDQLHTDRPS